MGKGVQKNLKRAAGLSTQSGLCYQIWYDDKRPRGY